MNENLAISFVLPVINETDSLKATVASIRRVAGGHLCEVLIVVAAKSSEASVRMARELQRAHPDQIRVHTQSMPGLGGALREAFDLAIGSHVMLMASDLETDPEFIPRFIETMQEGCWDIVVASRWMPGGGFRGYGRVRLVLNRLFQHLLRWLYGTRLTDLTFAYRLYRREVLQRVHWEAYGHRFLLECLLKPLRLDARIVEIPCTWQRRTEGRSSSSFWHVLGYAPMAMRIRFLPRSKIGHDIAC